MRILDGCSRSAVRGRMPRWGALVALVLLAAALSHCGGEADSRAISREVAISAHDGHDHGGHEGHDHSAHAPAGDLSLEELFAAACEHEIPAHQCDECRYELGLVKVAPELTERGLLTTAAVEERDFAAGLALTGEVQFDERRAARVALPATGTVRNVRVDLGSRVPAGAVLLELDCAELVEAESSYLEALAAARVAAQAHARHEELRAARITSEREYDEARQQREASAAQAQAARVRLLRLGLTDADLTALEQGGHSAALGVLRLRAPLAGQVLSIDAAVGERLEAGSQVLLLADLRSLWIWVDLYERDLPAVAAAQRGEGLPVTVSVGAYPGERFPGRIDFLSGVMETETRTVRARVAIENAGGRLRPGMFAQVHLPLGDASRAPAVPRAAVLSDEGVDFAFVRCREDYFVRRTVHTGRASDGHVEIASGLAPGDVVAVDGAFLLKSDVLREKMGAGCAD